MNTDAFVSHDNIANFRDDKENHYHFQELEIQKTLLQDTEEGVGVGKHAGLGKISTGVHLCSWHPDGNFQVGL